MDPAQEYEVESITRARVHDKRGKKITWKYYVKWKGYDWDESTWEPTDSFQGGSEHILESFWERIDTGGRDISDATAFKKGEELVISGPPGRNGLKRKAKPTKNQVSPSKDVPSSNGVTVSAPPLAARKRRRVQMTADDESGYLQLKRSASTANLKNGRTSARSPKRRRASSPGLRKSAPKRLPSAGDSQLDADGETDPDVVEVEDELMQVGAKDAEDNAGARYLATASENVDESKKITFDDLEHFYSGNPIDIDQNTEGQVAVQKPEALPPPHSSPEVTVLTQDDVIAELQAPHSPLSSYDPLFDSPSHPSDEVPEVQRDPILPPHRARVVNPLVKLIDTTTPETTGKQSRITAKARLMSIHTTGIPSIGDSSRGIAKRSRKAGPSRSPSNLVIKNRSSLLTATKGTLKSVKGKFPGASVDRELPDEVKEVPAARGRAEGDKSLVMLSSDGVVVHEDQQAVSNFQHGPPPSGDELLIKLAGLQADIEALPDYEDDSVAPPQDVETLGLNLTSARADEELCNQVADTSPFVTEAEQKVSATVANDPSVPSTVAPPTDGTVKANIELAKEHLFPSTQTSFNSFSTTHSSFRSTIFGPLYQGLTANHVPVAKNESSTTFKVIIRDGVELPLVLKDCTEIKAHISDILIGNSSGGKVAVFYSAEDALAMVSALKGDGTARVVLDPSAKTMQQEYLTFQQRFESSHTLVAPVGKAVCVLYSSENADISEKLEAPAHLRGLSNTLLISHASIENQLAYVAAAMKATAF